jgi:hypothetical protein
MPLNRRDYRGQLPAHVGELDSCGPASLNSHDDSDAAVALSTAKAPLAGAY